MNRIQLARVSAGVLLLAAKKASKDLQSAVTAANAAAISAAVKKQEDDRYHKAALLGTLALTGAHLIEALQDAILDARKAARSAAAQRAHVELKVAGVQIPVADLVTNGHDEDDARAKTAAQSLGSAWQAAAVYAALLALRSGTSVQKNLDRIPRSLAYRSERTGRTETFQAYSAEQREGLVGAKDRDDWYGWQLDHLKIGRRWDARLEACPTCASHDGEIVAYDENFRDDDEPGFVHPNCLCFATIISMTSENEEAA